MNATMKLGLVAVLAGVVMVASVVPASADAAGDAARQQYREAMWYFVPTIGQWARELQQTIQTAQVKPEQACKAMPELAYRGQGMVEDLAGTVPVPEMAEVHAALMGSVARMTEVAKTACSDPAQASTAVAAEMVQLNRSRHTLLSWLLSLVDPIQEPAQPVVGK